MDTVFVPTARATMIAPRHLLLALVASLLLSPSTGRTAKTKAGNLRSCSACLAAGYGWCPMRQVCGGFANKVCSGTLTDLPKPVRPYVADASSWSSLMARPEHVLVNYCVGYDGRCKQFAPEYALVASAFVKGKECVVAAVDCAADRALCEAHGVTAYPTVIFHATPHRGARGTGDQQLAGDKDLHGFEAPPPAPVWTMQRTFGEGGDGGQGGTQGGGQGIGQGGGHGGHGDAAVGESSAKDVGVGVVGGVHAVVLEADAVIDFAKEAILYARGTRFPASFVEASKAFVFHLAGHEGPTAGGARGGTTAKPTFESAAKLLQVAEDIAFGAGGEGADWIAPMRTAAKTQIEAMRKLATMVGGDPGEVLGFLAQTANTMERVAGSGGTPASKKREEMVQLDVWNGLIKHLFG